MNTRIFSTTFAPIIQRTIRTMNHFSLYAAFFTLIACPCSVEAADLIVDLDGIQSGNNYTSIGAAHTAAADGDRILIVPNVANYIENITLTKSVQLLSAVEGAYYKVQGSITIAPAAAGKTIEIHHMDLQNGFGITCNASPAGNRTNFRVFDSKLRGGSITCATANYDVNFSRDSLFNGSITFRVGRVIGNYIFTSAATADCITVNNDVATNDVNYVVGNWMRVPSGNSSNGAYGVVGSNSTQTLVVMNNFIKVDGSTFAGGINTGLKTGVNNLIENNTIFRGNSSVYLGIYVSGGGANGNIYNNLVVAASSSFGSIHINDAGSFLNVSYNASAGPGLSGQAVNNGTNLTDAGLISTVNANTGALQAGSAAIDAGHPGGMYTDLDGTRNDIGCWGGSYSRENFITSGNSLVTFMLAPRKVLSGGTIDISGDSIDR
jgi:hypothetical protein